MAKPTGDIIGLFRLPPQLRLHEIREKLEYGFMLSHVEIGGYILLKILVRSIFATLHKI